MITNLKDLFDKEIRASMVSLSLGLSLAVCLVLGWFQIQSLRNDLQLTEQFVSEITKNALVNEHPIMIPRSMMEFWRAFAGTHPLIKTLEIYFGEALISQVGSTQATPFDLQLSKCFTSGPNQTCIRYWVSPVHFLSQIAYVLVASLFSSFLVYLMRRKISARNVTTLTQPLEREVARIAKLSSEFQSYNDSSNGVFGSDHTNTENNLQISEIVKLNDSYKELFQHSKNFLELQKETEVSKSLSSMASQVAHDIRSPLSALNMILGLVPQLKEDQRVLIRNSVQRINDIANGLLESSKRRSHQTESVRATVNCEGDEKVFLNALVDSIVSEKRLQFGDKLDVIILPEIDMHETCFVWANPVELKRVLSNLVNNSVEAIEYKGRITVSLKKGKEGALIKVTDNGKGIPEPILRMLRAGAQGISFGKVGSDSGSGLGVHHAKTTIEGLGGIFEINSQEGLGTCIMISLPRVQAPEWFLESLQVKSNQLVVALDDDQSIHDIWLERFSEESLIKRGIRILNLKNGQALRDYVQSISVWQADEKNILFLIDYELAGEDLSGLDLIQELGLLEQSILVTSRHEEIEIQKRCETMGIRMLPKLMAGFVPIAIDPLSPVWDLFSGCHEGIVNPSILKESEFSIETASKIRYDLCLIDDDIQLIHPIWSSAAMAKGLRVKLFATPQDFLLFADNIDRSTPIYVDVSIGNGIKGTEFAWEIYQLGFSEINIATGYDASAIKVPSFISKVVGKGFPIADSYA